MKTKILHVQSLLWLALVLALAGSLKHLAAIFASVDGNLFLGWLQAIAIDTGLFALAFSIRLRKVAKRSTKPLWFGVTVFTGISVYGNLAYGLFATTGNLPGWITATKPIVLAGSLPILVLFLSELLSDDRQHAAEVAEREAKSKSRLSSKTGGKTQSLPEEANKLAVVNAERQANKQERLTQLAGILEDKPQASNTELATMLGVSRATIRNYRGELNGKVAQ